MRATFLREELPEQKQLANSLKWHGKPLKFYWYVIKFLKQKIQWLFRWFTATKIGLQYLGLGWVFAVSCLMQQQIMCFKLSVNSDAKIYFILDLVLIFDKIHSSEIIQGTRNDIRCCECKWFTLTLRWENTHGHGLFVSRRCWLLRRSSWRPAPLLIVG